jgi:hypothetical protein
MLMSLEVTELQGGGIRGRQILYFCNLEARHSQIFRKCYFLYLFNITENTFFWKSTLRLSCRYATFVRLRSPTCEAEILMPIWCFWIGHKSGYLQEFRKPSFCYGNIFLWARGCFQQPQHISATSNLSGLNFSGNDVHQQIQKWQKIGVWPTPMPFM